MRDVYIVHAPDGVLAAALAKVVRMPVNECSRRQYYVITQINVMDRHRGEGYGRKVLEAITADADSEGVALLLEPSAQGGLDQSELVAWYERHGFKTGAWHMLRRPEVGP